MGSQETEEQEVVPKTPKTQKTPKGAEIPIPTRKEVYEALERVAKARPTKERAKT